MYKSLPLNPVQSTSSQPVSLRSILIQSVHTQIYQMTPFLEFTNPNSVLISRFPMHATCPTHLTSYLIALTILCNIDISL